MTRRKSVPVAIAVMALLAASCGDDDDEAASTEPPATASSATEPSAVASTSHDEDEHEDGHEERMLDAPAAAITVDGDPSDWGDVDGLSFTMEAIEGEDVDSKEGSFMAAHDDEYLYVMFTVEDDFDWNAEDAHLSASPAVLWAIDSGAGAHMGAEEPERETSLGMVDIWHWELECEMGAEQGGRVNGPGDGDPGNDSGCNFDDEWSTTPEEREDDNGEGAENSLLGVFSHSNPVVGEDGTWYFEMSRPLQTGDANDAQFEVGGSGLLAVAYWDPDVGPDGWDDDEHVQTANQGFITVNLAE